MFGNLDRGAEELSGCLRPLAGIENVVEILLSEEELALYAAQLAALKAGASYLCLEERAPEIIDGDPRRHPPAALLRDAHGGERVRALSPSPFPLLVVSAIASAASSSHRGAAVASREVTTPTWRISSSPEGQRNPKG